LLERFMHAQERRLALRNDNRVVRPFEWGAEFVSDHPNGDDPRQVFGEYARRAVERSEEFYALPEIADYRLDDGLLAWTSAVATPSAENNTARAHFFPELTLTGKPNDTRRAVVILPHWNAPAASYFELARVFTRFGIAALRLTLPYHEERMPPELERADHLVSPNVGRTLQSMRQAVLDTRAAVRWLKTRGYERIGIVGTSIGSCVAFLALAHDPDLRAGVFNHASGYFADVVWRGLSTAHVREGIGDAATLEELREAWLPISPYAFAAKMAAAPARPIRFISARYDLTFHPDLTRDVIEHLRAHGHPPDVVWLRCGHYTLGAAPFKHIDGWKIVTFIRKHL
jgi:pimeloyl-ACP methyl ester carboxylesterase